MTRKNVGEIVPRGKTEETCSLEQTLETKSAYLVLNEGRLNELNQ